jgi:hypothetical protein
MTTHHSPEGTSMRDALEALLKDPHGCAFCDSGKLRKSVTTGELCEHEDSCGYKLAQDALATPVPALPAGQVNASEIEHPTTRYLLKQLCAKHGIVLGEPIADALKKLHAAPPSPTVQPEEPTPCSVCNALTVPRNATHYDAEDLEAARKQASILHAALSAEPKAQAQAGGATAQDIADKIKGMCHSSLMTHKREVQVAALVDRLVALASPEAREPATVKESLTHHLADASKMVEPAQALPQGGEVMDMALCESISVVLREGQLYRFRKVGDCEKCAAMSAASLEAYGEPPTPEAISASGAGVPVAWRPTCDVVMKQGGDFGPQRVFTPGDVLYASPPSLEAGKAVPLEWKKAVQEAYGWLWHVNNEPTAPVPMWSPEQAAYEARKNLRDLLTKDERGEAINAVSGMLENKARAHGIGTTVSTKEDAL